MLSMYVIITFMMILKSYPGVVTEPDSNEPKSNQGSVAAAVTIPVLLVIGALAAATVILLVLIYRKRQQAKLQGMDRSI